jgi:hypothetical protein
MAEREINFLKAVNSSSNIQIYVLDQQISLLHGYGPCLAAVIPRTRIISVIYVVGLDQEIQNSKSRFCMFSTGDVPHVHLSNGLSVLEVDQHSSALLKHVKNKVKPLVGKTESEKKDLIAWN